MNDEERKRLRRYDFIFRLGEFKNQPISRLDKYNQALWDYFYWWALHRLERLRPCGEPAMRHLYRLAERQFRAAAEKLKRLRGNSES